MSKGLSAPFFAAVVAFLITACGELVWGALAFANTRLRPEQPWSVAVMAVLLLLLLAYLAGFGPPARTAKTRRRLLRWNTLPMSVFAWAVFAGLIADIALAGVWIATSDIVRLPPAITPSMQGVPLSTAIAFLVMGSLAAPLSEEAAFRGYAQGILEDAWKWAPAAIVGSSILFALAHVTQGIFLPKLGLYFLAGLIFGTIAYLTNSLYAAMVVHSIADFEGFLLLWPHDAKPHAVGSADPLFMPAMVTSVVFVPLALLALRRLATMTRGNRKSN